MDGPRSSGTLREKQIQVSVYSSVSRLRDPLPGGRLLWTTTAPVIAADLLKIFGRVGIPREILTDQGMNVSSKLMAKLCCLLKIHTLKTSVYHPQTDGLVERFNGTLKTMLRKFVDDDPQHWDRLLPSLPFAVREVSQASTGFSQFELLYGRQPRRILDLLRET